MSVEDSSDGSCAHLLSDAEQLRYVLLRIRERHVQIRVDESADEPLKSHIRTHNWAAGTSSTDLYMIVVLSVMKLHSSEQIVSDAARPSGRALRAANDDGLSMGGGYVVFLDCAVDGRLQGHGRRVWRTAFQSIVKTESHENSMEARQLTEERNCDRNDGLRSAK